MVGVPSVRPPHFNFNSMAPPWKGDAGLGSPSVVRTGQQRGYSCPGSEIDPSPLRVGAHPQMKEVLLMAAPQPLGAALHELPLPVLSPAAAKADPWSLLGMLRHLVATGQRVDVIAWNAAVAEAVERRIVYDRIAADAAHVREALGGAS